MGELRTDWPKEESKPLDYSAAVITAEQLATMAIPPRTARLGAWMRSGDIGFIYAPRGVGKSWLSLLIGTALANGSRLGEWPAGEACPVLYVDGEMSLYDTKWRQGVIKGGGTNFRWLHHEHLSRVLEKALNIARPECQRAIGALIEDGSTLILDNLSALERGKEENNNDDWDIILEWLLELRRRKVTIIIVHHAGKNGDTRGGSRKEDHADWILSLKDDTNDDDERNKALVSTFTKSRGCPPKSAMPLRWGFTITDTDFQYECRPYDGPDALLAIIKSGVNTNAECAEALSAPKSSVTRWAQRLEKEGRINITGRKYTPSDS